MVNVGSSVLASVKMPMTIVTYPNQNYKRGGKKRNTESTEQDLKKSTLSIAGANESARRSVKDGHKYTAENIHSSESFKQNSGNHDFVMQRESMIFKTIPNRGNEEEKKESFQKRRVNTNDAVSISNSVSVA